MRFNLLLVLAALSFSPLTFAQDAKCTCSEQCMAECKKGEGKDCSCKSCDCAKTGKCGDGSCEMEHKSGEKTASKKKLKP
jgi:hypothetical protein